MRSPLAAALLALSACASGPPLEPLPAPLPPDPLRAREERVVALWNGRPVTWGSVAERLMESELKHAVDEHVRAQIVEDRRAGLGIAHTPEEMRRRAREVIRQTRQEVGEDVFRAMLSRENFTEETYAAHLEGSERLSAALSLEKIVRYQAVHDGWVEIDWMVFARAEDARRFEQDAQAGGFEAAADAVMAARPAGVRRLRELFAAGLSPVDPELDPATAERLRGMKPGAALAAPGRGGLHFVVRLADVRPPNPAPYDRVKGEVLELILSRPPSAQELRNWVNREFGRARIEYRRPGPAREPGR